jgi:glycosyltransferase 2 family protein
MNDAQRRRAWLALRLVVSLLLLAAVLVYADVQTMAEAIRDASWGWFAAALGLMAASSVVGAVRWRMLLRHAHVEVTELRAVRAFAGALFLNNVLPTAVGGDAVRAWLVGREGGGLVRATTATLVDKVTALGCLFVVAWIALIVDGEDVPGSIVTVLAWVTAGLLTAFVLAGLVAAGARPIVRRLPERLANMIREAWWALRRWAASARLMAWVLGLGLAYGAFGLLVFVLVAKAVGVELSFALAAATTPVVLVAMLIPVSIGGLGVREGGFVLLLGEAGVSAADATLLALLSTAAILVATAAVVAATAGFESLRTRAGPARPLPRRPSS